MDDTRKWGSDQHQYVRRPGQRRRSSPENNAQLRQTAESQKDACAIWWDHEALDFTRIQHGTVERSRARFRASLPNLIWNAAALEGNTFTLPEVQTLLDGVTVGGKPSRDAEQVLALSEGYSFIDDEVAAGRFMLSKPASDQVHTKVAIHEAIESGHFRGEDAVQGGGAVRLANGGTVAGFPSGAGGGLLRERYDRMLEFLASLDDPRERALVYFASATRQQFYFDGNKRTARLMMSGELMRSGYDVVSVPFARKFEFNIALDHLFTTDDATPLLAFLISCADLP
ncbi:MAG: hypothetical protein ACTIJ6_02430 [Leucobacter sp.]